MPAVNFPVYITVLLHSQLPSGEENFYWKPICLVSDKESLTFIEELLKGNNIKYQFLPHAV